MTLWIPELSVGTSSWELWITSWTCFLIFVCSSVHCYHHIFSCCVIEPSSSTSGNLLVYRLIEFFNLAICLSIKAKSNYLPKISRSTIWIYSSLKTGATVATFCSTFIYKLHDWLTLREYHPCGSYIWPNILDRFIWNI